MADQLNLLGALPEQPSDSAPPQQSELPAVNPALQPQTRDEPQPVRSAEPSTPATLLILDTETTGLDPDQDQCVEVGVILFDVAARAVLAQQSFLLPVQVNAAEPINRIPAAVSQRPQPWRQALVWFETLVAAADVVVAHNAAFDRQWFGHGQLPAIHCPWLCTMEDLRWPADRQLRSRPSVRDLALAYGVPVWSAHRALTDCIYLAEVFARCDDLEQMLRLGMEPRRLMRARVSYEDRHLAREAGFRWNDPVKGAWTRRLSERETTSLGFPVVPVDFDADQRVA
ncbi:MAG: 3'-5' exonuclease [Synechococcus sp. BS307-5m-G38]|nr:3'-5' exonuclease [Synechococcus sp. BS307-5m-G38]